MGRGSRGGKRGTATPNKVVEYSIGGKGGTIVNVSKTPSDKAMLVEKYIQEDYYNINVSMPKFQGTEKQINYANDLAKKQIYNLTELFNERFNRMIRVKGYEDFKQLASKTFGKSINSKNEALYLTLKKDKNIKFLTEETSAKAIIEKFSR